ncbi:MULTISPECIES: aspartate kinase [Cytobacillus]|uniref:aspartate kinase n=1 Tax=Cytobacillus TaxID=2675230 RepID=UPI001CD6E33F|nr:aspartate kinase [Cytobacillus kochii]MCA1024721.1 aspartate kinase [Cytobacillus kochii]MCM3323796.1 aspartate kinase [Cytobacillus kochii]MCM3346023.1 aspartate kinase [Cytobacillus kochii]MDM5206414.1 aspartate kinase [Cytobacillus kochii]
MKVVKFGGSSLADAKHIKRVFDIVHSDNERRIIVVSAPGKRHENDTKVTDLLISCGLHAINNEDPSPYIEQVVARYKEIADDLILPPTIIETIQNDLLVRLAGDKNNPEQYLDCIKASGEDNHAKLVACYFQEQGVKAKYMNPREAGLIVSNEHGNAQVLPKSYEKLRRLRESCELIIFPGFFGYGQNGGIFTFSRSGSDVTGSILAYAVKADVYENFTDVDAVFSVNPTFVDQPKEIKELTYREMRELSYAGFTVLHEEALIPAIQAGIPVQIKNTNNPSARGTTILRTRKNQNGPVVGIASATGFCSIYVSKYLLNREIGFGRKLYAILEEFGISYEHTPSGIDDVTVIIKENQLQEDEEEVLLKRLESELVADEVHIQHSLALIMVVGEGMRHNIGTMARAANALAKADVNIEMINQGSSEVSMMFAVKEVDEKKAVQALYEEFFAEVALPIG